MREYTKYRFLEMLPGFLVWATFILAAVFSFLAPLWVMGFIILFDLYWLVRLAYLQIYLFIGFRRFRKATQTNWEPALMETTGWEKIYHVIFYPTYKEPYEVLKTSLDALVVSKYPNKKGKFIIVLAGEEADQENFNAIAVKIEQEFKNSVFAFLTTVHPKNVPGELAGKGSNLGFAGRKSQQFLDEHAIPYTDVIVSSFDADTRVHPQYFSYLTYTFLHHPNRQQSSYQPIALFNNNVWDAPSFARVVSYSTTFWLMTEQIRPERLFTFSSHSMPMQALVDVGFWQSDIVTEDSRICLQCFQHYDGNYEVTPLYIPVSMDVVMGSTIRETLKNQYVQQRRWAYGVENFAYMVWNFGSNHLMPRAKKFRYIWNQIEGVYSWATAPILILVLGRLPLWLMDEAERQTSLALNTPYILQILMRVSLFGVVIAAVLGSLLLPKRPKGVSRNRGLYMIFQWPLLIVSLIVFGSIPATDAQTRLMLGKYLGFDVTKKVRKRLDVT